MAATLAKVKATKPDVLVVSGHSKGALTAIRQISEMKVDVPMLAMTHCDASKLANNMVKILNMHCVQHSGIKLYPTVIASLEMVSNSIKNLMICLDMHRHIKRLNQQLLC